MNQYFYHVLFAVAPERLKQEFEDAVNNDEFDHAIRIIANVLTGRW